MADLSTVKAGDRVWVGNRYGPCRFGLQEVYSVTDTEVVVDWNGRGTSLAHFAREDGREIVANGRRGLEITEVASQLECDRFYAQQRAESEARQQYAKKHFERAALLDSMTQLFVGGSATDEQWEGVRNGIKLVCDHLTEDRIREIASLLAKNPAT